jgi:hypothetical protein
MGSGYLRPGYSVPPQYNIPTPVRMGINGAVSLDATAAAAAKKYVPPGGRPWASTNVVDQQQELQRLLRIRAAAQKVMYFKHLVSPSAFYVNVKLNICKVYMLNHEMNHQCFHVTLMGFVS